NSRENEPLPPSGEKVPASTSCRRKALTSRRNSLASGGNSIGSKRKLGVIFYSRSCGDKGPELVGAVRCDHPAETGGPDRLVAELLAPRPQPAGRVVQRVLIGETHCTMYLVGNSRTGAGGLATPDFGDRDLADRDRRKRACFCGSVGGGARRG